MAQIIYIIGNQEKLQEFKEGFLKECPIPVDKEGEPTMTALEWIKEWGKQQFLRAYLYGKTRYIEESAIVREDLIE